MPVMLLWSLGLPLILSSQRPACASTGLGAYTGFYGSGDPSSDAVVHVQLRHDALLMRPILWSGPMVLRQVTTDSFLVEETPRFGMRFIRGEAGCIEAAHIRGLTPSGRYRKLGDDEQRPVMLLVAGLAGESARHYRDFESRDIESQVAVARALLRAPTQVQNMVTFLSELVRFAPDAAAVHAALGDALVQAGDRRAAAQHYSRALELEPKDASSQTAMRLLESRPATSGTGWQLPFSLDELFAAPSSREIAAVLTDWRARDLSPTGVRVVARHRISLDGIGAEARVMEHLVHGVRHVGVVVVPDSLPPGQVPIVVEAKGVSADFFPLEIPNGLTSPRILAADRGRVIYVLPGYRGERVIIGGDTLSLAGDRRDAWDGATDDLLATLHAALTITPEADHDRICVFGRSRGGTVALLAGIREPRIECVVSWAAPTDWFELMGLAGWKQSELVAEGLSIRAGVTAIGGQFINYFLTDAIGGTRPLAAVRHRMIARSPLYFANHARQMQVHWGLDDGIVPVINGERFVAQHRAGRADGGCLEVQFHPNAGHDQDRQLAPMHSRAYLVSHLFGDRGAIGACTAR